MDPLFGPGTLDDLVSISEATMTEPFLAVRPGKTATGSTQTDDMGNPVGYGDPGYDDPTEVAEGYCRISFGSKTDKERMLAGKMENPDLVGVAFRKGTDVQEGDQVWVRGLLLEIIWVPDPIPTNSIDLRTLAQREGEKLQP